MIRRLGRLHRAEGRLRAGDTVLDQDNTLLPLLARATSLGISLYHGNRRIASTSALGVGKPGEIGGYADAELVDVVLRKREIFKGSLKRNGLVYLITARPLYPTTSPDEQAPIGMIEAFQSEQTFYESLVAAARIGVEQRTAAQEEAADGMEGVIHFLDDVARRLQLLALNGNIIAAQAASTAAFRVVCRELGTLADRGQEAPSPTFLQADADDGSRGRARATARSSGEHGAALQGTSEAIRRFSVTRTHDLSHGFGPRVHSRP